MRPKVTLRRALEDDALFGSVLGGPSWHAWRSLLLAANGEPLNPDEYETFRKFTGRPEAPKKRVDELWCAIGRRGGKTRAMATMSAYYAGLCEHPRLARGEKGVVLLIAQDKRAAKISLDYVEGALESTPMLRQLIKDRRREELVLNNGIIIEHGLRHFVVFVVQPVLPLYAMRLRFGDQRKAQILTRRFCMQ